MDNYDKELMDRVIRIESRVVQLGDHVGANLRTTQRIKILEVEAGVLQVNIDALDVSLSRIFAELRQRYPGHPVQGIKVMWCDKVVMTL